MRPPTDAEIRESIEYYGPLSVCRNASPKLGLFCTRASGHPADEPHVAATETQAVAWWEDGSDNEHSLLEREAAR